MHSPSKQIDRQNEIDEIFPSSARSISQRRMQNRPGIMIQGFPFPKFTVIIVSARSILRTAFLSSDKL